MNCQNKIIYQILPGDTLYKIAQKYKVTPEIILQLNKGLEPHNLKVGTNIIICHGIQSLNYKENYFSLNNEMHSVWEEHVWWTRMLVLNIIDELAGADETAKRLLKNPSDIAQIYGRYYNQATQDKIRSLMTTHLVIGADLIKAVKNNNSQQIEILNKEWYENADDIANALASINHFYNKETLRKMLYEHLDLTKKEVSYRVNKQYQEDVKNYDALEAEALMMADYLSDGIYRQFINHFR